MDIWQPIYFNEYDCNKLDLAELTGYLFLA